MKADGKEKEKAKEKDGKEKEKDKSKDSKDSKDQDANVLDLLREKKIDLVVNIPHSLDTLELTDGYHIRRTAVDFHIPLICNIKAAILFVDCLDRLKSKQFSFGTKCWQEYMQEAKLM